MSVGADEVLGLLILEFLLPRFGLVLQLGVFQRSGGPAATARIEQLDGGEELFELRRRVHLAGLDELTPELAPLVGRIALAAKKIARDLGIASTGYRFVSNCGPDAGQTVAHLHFHLLGGGPMGGRMTTL